MAVFNSMLRYTGSQIAKLYTRKSMEDSRLVKEVVFGEMKIKTKRGRPKREWLDDVKEWCNEEIYIIKGRHKTETRGK